MIIESYKPIGCTTVEHLNHYKKKYPNDKMCFAGRLDPLAHGKIYILIGEDRFRKDEFCNKDKIYETFVIKGFITDTFDIMGIPTISNNKPLNIPSNFEQKYPPYSSVMIPKYRKQYWKVTREKLPLLEHEIPTKNVSINIEYIDNFSIKPSELIHIIKDRINRVNPNYNFRQKKIIKSWENILSTYTEDIEIVKLRVTCSSGTYIRNIGNMMNGCCYDIHRTSYL